jgi:two-component system response regulator FixJ
MPAPESAQVVYIVDDDADVRGAIQLLVRSCGWRARGFESGQAFLAASLADRDACLILDLNMPQMDGEDVLRELRQRGSSLPTVVITGDRHGTRLDRVRRLGARDVLQKPFTDNAFQAAVEACLREPAG